MLFERSASRTSHLALACIVALVALVWSARSDGAGGAVLRPTATLSLDAAVTPILSADGGRIAAAAGGRLIAWNPATGAKRSVVVCDTGTIEVARAGNRIASVCIEETIGLHERDLEFAWLERSGFDVPVWTLASADLGCAGTCLGNVAGNGDLLVFNTFRTKRAKQYAGRWWLWRIVGTRKVLVVMDVRSLAVAAVDSGRIFVRRGRELLVIDASGRRLASYPSPGSGRIVVDGNSLVARTRTGVSVLDLGRGAVARRWKLPQGAVLQDTNAASFVYTINLTIHIHRLDAAHEVAFTLDGIKGPITTQLTASGLFYAWRDVTCCTGYVGFVPSRALPAPVR